TKTESVLDAFRLVFDALRTDATFRQRDANALIRARVEELLGAIQDPDTRKRAMDLLETILSFLAPQSATLEGEKTVAHEALIPVTGSP
ncbi:hypothetical protein AB4Z54_59525, partial [Streptomyces sp. MCAF7]